MKKNALLQRQKELAQVNRDAAAQTYAQYMAEMFALALNDPEVMGKDTLGEARLIKLNAAVQKYFNQFHRALSTKPEADHYRAKLDERLEKIYKGSFIPFLDRYDWVGEIRTGRG